MQEQVEKLFRQYRLYHDSQGQGQQRQQEPNNVNDNIVQVAESTFQTLFGKQRVTKDFLLRTDEGGVKQEMRSWVEEGYPDPPSGDIITATKEECSEKLEALTANTTASTGEKVVWPYIRHVKYVYWLNRSTEGVWLTFQGFF